LPGSDEPRAVRTPLTDVPVARRGLLRPGRDLARTRDVVAVEEPLEIRVAGETVGVIMRTPGDDHRLALGFLFAEGVLTSAEDVAAIYHCGRPDDDGYGNLIELAPSSGAGLDWDRLDGARRPFAASSACGVCGRRAVEDLRAGRPEPQPGLLAVSSRAGVEVVQKAARAGVVLVATVSAPTSLAVQLARSAGLTLAAFVRGGGMNVYAGGERITDG
jgi:formate dehydrogenase assembly factor FdhD